MILDTKMSLYTPNLVTNSSHYHTNNIKTKVCTPK